jgi:hypothetical protein
VTVLQPCQGCHESGRSCSYEYEDGINFRQRRAVGLQVSAWLRTWMK